MKRKSISDESLRRIAQSVEPSDLLDRIERVYSHLSAVMMQTVPSDDEIIIGHVQDALDIVQGIYRELTAR